MASESATQQLIRRDFPLVTRGQIWRNNSGAFKDEEGRLIRFGLGNDSPALNKVVKSSDLIGITPVQVTPEMVGYWLGVFTAIEVKEPGWVQRPGDKRASAQAAFHDIVRAACGYAGFATHVDDMHRIIRRG